MVRLPVLLQSNPRHLTHDGPITPIAPLAETDVRGAATAAAVERAERVEEAEQEALDLTLEAQAELVQRRPSNPMLRCPSQNNQTLASPSSRPQAHRFGLLRARRGRSN